MASHDPVQAPLADVSRETPAVARRVFPPDRLRLLERYADLLATDGIERGLIGPREAPRLWGRHLLGCAALAEVVAADSTVCDVGSGAGLPGLVIALAQPSATVTLVEPMQRRCAFLTETVATLGIENVEVVRARAEELHGRRTFDVVTSRAVAPLERLLAWSMPLVAPTGVLVAMKGSSVAEELPAAMPLVERWQCTAPEILTLDVDGASTPTTVVRVSWADPTRVGWRVGTPTARATPHRSSTRRQGRR